MKNLFKNKTFLIVTAVCIVFLVYFAFDIYQYVSRDKNPVMFEYDQDSGIITFQVQPKYELQGYFIKDMDRNLSEFKTTENTITFDVNQVHLNSSSFIVFNCRWINKENDKPVIPCKYEILRADNETCIMKYDQFDNPTKSVCYPPLKSNYNKSGLSIGKSQKEINLQLSNNNEIIAIVNDYEITKKSIQVYKSNTEGKYSDEELLNKIIERRVLYSEAVNEGYAVTDEEIETIIEDNRSALGKDENVEQYEFLLQYIKGLGITEDEYWKEIASPIYKENYSVNKLISKLKENYFKENESLDPKSLNDSFSGYLSNYKKDLVAKANIQIFE